MIIWRSFLITALSPLFVLFILLCCAALCSPLGAGAETWALAAGSPQLGWAGPTPMCPEGSSLQTQLRRKQTREGSGSLVGVQRDAVPAVGGGFTTLQHSGDLLFFAFCGGVCWQWTIFHLKNGSSFAVHLPRWRFCCSSSGELEEPTALTPQSQGKACGLEEPFERLLNLNLAASVVNESKEQITPNQAHVAVKGI